MTTNRSGAHIFGVVRHAERADAAFAVQTDGVPRWTQSNDAQMWPFDPPLTEEGKHSAGETGIKIQAFADECGTKVDVIVCSPYCRCVQTASAICSKLRPACRILIDHSLGEIFGPATMSSVGEPNPVVRPYEGMIATHLVRKQLTGGGAKTVGTWPQWPEDPRTARQRYANRFLTLLQRSMVTTRNFLLVTHADCVGSALSVMPSHADYVVEKIDYCGMFFARRQTGEAATSLFSQLDHHLQVTPEDEGAIDAADEAMIKEHKAAEGEHVDVPDHSWQVRIYGMKVHCLTEDGANASVFEKRAKALEKNTKMSQDKIKFLLGALTDTPLRDKDFLAPSHMSDSTLLFNKSADAASSVGQSSGSFMNSMKLPDSQVVLQKIASGSKVPSLSGASGSAVPQPMGAAAQPQEDQAEEGGEGKASRVKCSRLTICKDILRFELKGQEEQSAACPTPQAKPPIMQPAGNSLLQRRGNNAVGPLGRLKISL